MRAAKEKIVKYRMKNEDSIIKVILKTRLFKIEIFRKLCCVFSFFL